MYLAAIIPPNNAETALLAVKRKIFRETSALSSWALKPMIPFLFTTETPKTLNRADLPALPEDGLIVDQISELNSQYVLGSAFCSDFCTGLSKIFIECGDCRTGVQGLQILDTSDTEYSSRAKIINTADGLLSDLDCSLTHWRSCSLAVFRVEPGILTAPGWWKRVVLETVQEISFSKVPIL